MDRSIVRHSAPRGHWRIVRSLVRRCLPTGYFCLGLSTVAMAGGIPPMPSSQDRADSAPGVAYASPIPASYPMAHDLLGNDVRSEPTASARERQGGGGHRHAGRAPRIKKSPVSNERPVLRIRPRRARDLWESLGLGGSVARIDAALPRIEETLHAGANTVRASWRKLTAGPSAGMTASPGDNDPFEAINRLSFSLNWELQEHVLEPVSEYYLANTTVKVRDSVRNFFGNLREPLSIASFALEGDISHAGNATARFAINTTVGIGGLFDKAAELGFPRRPRDLEATACAYGVPAGPYVVLPILGPATLRDAVIRVTTMAIYLQVMGLAVYVPYRGTSIAVQYTDVRDKKDFVESIALDPYIAYRTLYTRMRQLSCGRDTGEDQYFTR